MPLFLTVEEHYLTLSPQLILLSLNLRFSGTSTSATFRLHSHTFSTIPPSTIKGFQQAPYLMGNQQKQSHEEEHIQDSCSKNIRNLQLIQIC